MSASGPPIGIAPEAGATGTPGAPGGSPSPAVAATAARQGALGLIGAISAGAGGLVLTVTVSRLLPARDAGIYFTAVALFTIATSVLMLGADTGLVRALSGLRAARRPELIRPVLAGALRPVIVVSVAVALAVALGAQPLAQLLFPAETADRMAGVLRLLAPFLVLSTTSMVLLNGAARGLGSLRTFTTVQQVFLPVSRPLLLAATVLAGGLLVDRDVELPSTATLAVAAWALPLLVAALLAVREVRRLVRLRTAGDGTAATGSPAESPAGSPEGADQLPAEHGVRAFWRHTAPRGVAATFEVLIVWADVVLVTALLGAAPAAVYAAASRFVTSGTFALQAVRLSVGPLLAAAFARNDHVEAESVHRLSVRWAVLSTWPVYLALAIFAPGVLSILGPHFASAATTLALLSTAMLAVVTTGNANTVLNMARHSTWAAMNTGAAIVVMLSLDLLLVPRLGILGAGIGWSAAMLTDALAGTIEIRRGLGLHSMDGAALRTGLTVLLAFGVPAFAIRTAFQVGGTTTPAVVVLLVGGLVATGCYLAALVAQRVQLGLDELVGALRRRPAASARPAIPVQRPTEGRSA